MLSIRKIVKINLGLFILLSVHLGVLQGCKTETGLNPVSRTDISDQEVFETPERILGLVNGVYRELKAVGFYGGRYLLYQDFRGEDFLNLTSNSYTAYESWNNSYSSGSNDINNLWTAAYATINRANILIEGLARTDLPITAELASSYVAEAKLLRALSYFSLVTVFSQPYNKDQGASPGLPLRLQAETGVENNDLARSSVAEVYTQILKDLDEAEADLLDEHATALLNTTRAHKNTARALKTRVYLTISNYDKVIDEAKKIVPQTAAPFAAAQGVKHVLQDDIQTLFGADFTTEESIFSMPMSNLDAPSGQSAVAYIFQVTKEYYLNPTGILASEQWGANDRRRVFQNDVNGRQYFRKYTKISPYVDYIPVIRYAEVLLNYAEAAAENNDLELAASLLKAVHQRSDASYVFPNSITSTKEGLLQALASERRIELLGEGFAGFDLLRHLQELPAKGNGNIQTSTVSVDAENYIFPAPNTELATNKLF